MQTDCFIVDSNGNVDPATSIIWDFPQVTRMTVYPIDETVLTVTGGKFTTIANSWPTDAEYMTRGIAVTRSNTILDGIVHLVTGEGGTGTAYGGFYCVTNAVNVTFQNCIMTGHKPYSQATGVRGNYDFSADYAANIKVINIVQSNSIYDGSFWGISGFNYIKNMVFDNVQLSRIDAHTGFYNVTIRNSQLGHGSINAIGGGLLYVENTTITADDFVAFRGDYGAIWEGNVVIRNCEFTPTNFHTSRIIDARNDGQWDFGFPCVMPETITIEGLRLDESRAPPWYEGIILIAASNTGAREPFPYALTRIITISGFTSIKPWVIPNDYIRDRIQVITL